MCLEQEKCFLVIFEGRMTCTHCLANFLKDEQKNPLKACTWSLTSHGKRNGVEKGTSNNKKDPIKYKIEEHSKKTSHRQMIRKKQLVSIESKKKNSLINF